MPEILKDKFCLKFSVLNIETIVPLKVASPPTNSLTIGKLRVFYFFSRTVDDFRKWINTTKQISVHLCADDEILGTATLQLNQFASGLIDKLDYMVLFSSSKLKLCSLKTTIGFVQMKSMDLESVKLIPQDHIFIPPEDFFTADPLPDEWLEAIPRLSTQLPLDTIVRMTDPEHVRPASAKSIDRRPSSVKSKNSTPIPSSTTPISMSKILIRRSSISATQKQDASVTHRASIVSMQKDRNATASPKIRPQSAPLKRSKVTPRPVQDGAAPRKASYADLKDADANQLSVQVLDHSLEMSKAADEAVYQFNIRIGSVMDLMSIVDESWTLHYELFNIVYTEYESFQLFSQGPLVFDKEAEYYIVASESALMNYFGKERIFKVVLTPKYNAEDERTAAIDLRFFQKNVTYESMVPVENVRAEDVDATKFMETDSADDDDNDDGNEESNDKVDKQHIEAKMQVTMSIRKLKSIAEYQNLEICNTGEHNFQLVTADSVKNNLVNQVQYHDTLNEQ